jgi:transposase
MRAYSMDLRERILRDSDAGLTANAVAEKYDVSRAWVDRLKQRRRETGEVTPRAQRYGPHPKLGPHLHRLADLIQQQPDRTLVELQEALGLPASLATIWRAVKQLGFTVKKNGARLRTRSARHRGRAATVEGRRADVGPRVPRLSR